MKSIMTDNIVKILKSDVYKDFDFMVNEIPNELKKNGIDVTVKFGGKDLTRIMFFQNMGDGIEKDITPLVEEILEKKEMFNPKGSLTPSF